MAIMAVPHVGQLEAMRNWVTVCTSRLEITNYAITRAPVILCRLSKKPANTVTCMQVLVLFFR